MTGDGKADYGIVTGCFDILHQGHASLINQAQAGCEQLIIGVETDERVRQKKGPTRPIYSQNDRLRRLGRVAPQAYLVLLPRDFGREAVRQAWLTQWPAATLFVQASDPYLANKRAMMQKLGGKVITVDGEQNLSSTAILAHRQSADYLLFSEDRQFL